MIRTLKLAGSVALVFAIGIGCDNANNPIAPGPPGAVITVTADPSEVAPDGLSLITVSAARPDGNSSAGEMVTLTTDFGSLSETTLTLGADGKATTTFTAPAAEGEARITATLGLASGRVTVEVVDRRVAASPAKVELDHSRENSGCEDPISPRIRVSNLGDTPIDFAVVDDLPAWLTVDSFSGGVPGSFRAIFTCDVGEGNLDLSHEITVQGIDPVTAEPAGRPATVTVDVHVRP